MALDAPDVRAEAAEQRGVVARAGADVEDPLVPAQLEQLSIRATTSGCEIVWPAPIGSGTLSQASAASAFGTNSPRGTSRIASSTRSSEMCGRSCSISRVGAAEPGHAITPPAARTSASARSESPGSISTPRTAVVSTVTWKPARSASSAVFLTQ